MESYTVILIYPDHIASNYGQEFFTTDVPWADSPADALRKARLAALEANGLSADPESDDYCDPCDFGAVAVFEGIHENISPE